MRLLDILFTRRCPFCEKVIALNENECGECRLSLPKPGKRELCGTLCAYSFPYSGAYRTAILNYKFKNQHYLAQTLSYYMLSSLKAIDTKALDVVTDVPAYMDKRHKFNHSRLLAECIAKRLSLPCRQLLLKTVKTEKQHNLSRKQRTANVKNVFKAAEKLDGSRVLLVDDIITTGCTMTECINALKFGGADRVYGVALCSSL